MAYKEYLQEMLAPLGVYELGEDSISGAMLAVVGECLDEVWQTLQDQLRDSFPQRAEDPALREWERILPRHPHRDTLADRKESLTRLLSCEEMQCTLDEITALLSDCGVEAELEVSTNSLLLVRITSAPAAQTNISELRRFVRGLIPAHLAIGWL